MSDQDTAREKIHTKWKEVKNIVGNKVSDDPVDAGFDGWVQQCEHGRIYWHPTTGAHEVHGGILTKYLTLGGPNLNPETNRRDLGFPKTDEIRTTDGICKVSEFEWGAIYWIHGGVSIYGSLYEPWKRHVTLRGEDYPITDPIEIAGGEAIYFYDRCWYMGKVTNNKRIEGVLSLPPLGKPLISDDPKNLSFPKALNYILRKNEWDSINRDYPSLLCDLWKDRLVLQRVNRPAEETPLTFRRKHYINWLDDLELDLLEKSKKTPEEGLDENQIKVMARRRMRKPWEPYPGDVLDKIEPPIPPNERPFLIGLNLRPTNHGALKNRNLYNIGFKKLDGKTYIIKPHALYIKKSWDNFGFIHATDLHVSWRLEGFRQKLRQRGKDTGSEKYNNFNNGFRDMIAYANHLHDIGMIDFILVTGDLVDYQREGEKKSKKNSNFELFRKLILGQAPTPDRDGVKNEELRVPIYVTPGNHDYREIPYDLRAVVKKEILGIGEKKQVKTFHNLNITEDEAIELQDGEIPVRDVNDYLPILDPKPDTLWDFYSRRDVCLTDYIVPLGPHHLIMMNSRWDRGIPSEIGFWDAIKIKMGWLNEEERDTLDGNPDQLGFTNYNICWLKGVLEKLRDDGPEGLVIVGLHGQPFNPKGSEFPHYFRETEHPNLDEEDGEIESYLRRQNPLAFLFKDASSVHTNWPRTGTPYFKKGGIDDLLDYGISGGKTEDFLEMCVGEENGRPIDLVLCGHGHRNVEYHLKWNQADKFLFFTDFYTENPRTYYPSKDYPRIPKDSENWITEKDGPIHIRVTDRPIYRVVTKVRDSRGDEIIRYRVLDVPPYPNPLNTTPNPKAWWRGHRPLIIQTSSLGPLHYNQRRPKPWPPAFQGFRVISVKNKVLAKIRYVILEELRENRFKMPWEPESQFIEE